MTKSLFSAFRHRPTTKTGVILAMSMMLMMAATRPSVAQSLVVQQQSFSPATVQIGGSFTFAFNLYSPINLSNAIVAVDIRAPDQSLLLQKIYSGQNFQAGQTTPYSWSGTISSGKTLSEPFTPAMGYVVVVHVFNSNYTAQYATTPVLDKFAVIDNSTVPTVGYASIAPITPPVSNGHTYYVSDPSNVALNQANLALLPAGATVFTTLQAAANVTQPGDTVLVMNGTYQLATTQSAIGVLYVTTSGSAAGGYITYAAYPGAHPIVTTENSTAGYDAIGIDASYIVIQGFETIGAAQALTLATATQGSQTEFTLLKQEYAAGQPLTYPQTVARELQNGNCIGIGTGSAHVIIVNNLVHDCSAAGVDVESSDYINIEANTVYNTSWWTVYDTSGISLHRSLNSDSSTGYKNFVLDNVSYNSANTQPYLTNVIRNIENPGSANGFPTDGNGIIIDSNQVTSSGSPYLGRTLVAGNLTYDNGASGIHAYSSQHVDIVNNTAYLNDICIITGSYCGNGPRTINGISITGIDNGQIYSLSGNDINIVDNVLYAPAGKYIETGYTNTEFNDQYNILSSADGKGVVAGFVPDPTDIRADPSYKNPSNPVLYNFTFASGSPGIDAGIPFSNDDVSVPALLNIAIVNGMVNIGSPQPH